jgi:TP901 family phage tail tape measure protein
VADESLIQIGAALNFDQKSVESLNMIFRAVEEIDRRMKNVAKGFDMFTNESKEAFKSINRTNEAVGTMVKRVESVRGVIQTVTKTYKDLDGTITIVTDKINKENGEIQRQVQIVKDLQKQEKETTQTLTKEYDLRKKIANESNKINNPAIAPTKNIVKDIENAVSKTLTWLGAMTLVYGTLRGIQSAYKTMIDVENEATNIFKVLPQATAQKQMNQLLPAAISLAKQYGQSVVDVERSMGVWARQTKNTNDIITLTRASILASTATDISYEDSVKDISAITAEWKMNATQAYHVVDVLNEHSNNYRVTAQGLAEALAKTGSGAKAAGMSFEQLSGILTTSIQSLGLEGGEAGTFISRVMARMIGNNKAKQAIEKLGISTMQPLSKIMDQLMVKWDGMSSAAKRNFAVIVAGTNHWNKFVGLLDNGATIIQATADAYLSAGSAQKEVTTMMGTTQKQIAQLNASWQEFIMRNESFLNIVKFMVNVLNSVVNGMNKANTATLAFFATLTGLSVLVGILTGNWALLVGSLAVAGVTFGLMGKGAMTATQRINELKVAQEQLAQKIEGGASTAQGIKYLTDQYNTLRTAINKAKESGENYHSLQVKLNIVEDKLIQVVSRETGLREDQLRKYKDLNTASKQALQNVLDEVNGNRRLEALKRAEIVSTQGAKLTAHLTTLQMLDDEYQAFMHYEKLKQGAINNPKEAFKMGWERGGGWKSPVTGLVSAVLSSMSGGKLSFENPVMKLLYKSDNGFMKWLGTTPYSRFEDNPYMKEFLGRRSGLNVTWDDIKKLIPNLTLEELYGYNKLDDDMGGNTDFGNGKKESINVQMSNFNKAQAEWIKQTALTNDAGVPDSEKQKILYKYVDELGNIVKKPLEEFKASSTALSAAEKAVTDFNTAISDLVSGFKSAIDASDSLVKSFHQLKQNPSQEWQTSLDKAFDGLVKPRTDMEQQVDDLFTKVSSIFQENLDKVNNDIVNRQNLIQKSWEQIGENNSYIKKANIAKEQLDKGIPIDPKLESELIAVLGGFRIDVTDITSGTVDQLIALIKAKNDELKRLNSGQTGVLINSGDFYSKLKAEMDKTPALQKIYDNIGSTIGTSYTNVLNKKNALSAAQPEQGSYAEYNLKGEIYNAEVAYEGSIQQAIDSLKVTKDKNKDMAKGIDVLIAWLKNILQQSKNQLDKPVDPWQKIEDKYKFTDSSDYDNLAKQLGQSSGANLLDKIGIDYGKSLDKYKDKVRDQIAFLKTLTPGTDEYNNRLKEVKEELQEINRMQIIDKISDVFKAVLKGVKSFKEAFADMGKESRSNSVDSFMDNFAKKFNEKMEKSDKDKNATLVNTFSNITQSLSQSWKEMSKNEKFQLIMSVASTFAKTGNSQQAYQEQGIVNGASSGFQVGGVWGAIVGGVLGFASGNKQYKEQKKQQNADLRSSIQDSMNSDAYKAYQDFLSAGTQGFGWTSKKHTLAGITSIFGTDKEKLHTVDINTVIAKWQQLYQNGGINDLINSGNTYLLQTLEKWQKFLDTLGTSTSNIASSLESAFAATNYYDFVQGWGQSLEDMTRTALIRGFLAQGPLQTAYQNLSNTIGTAVLDGVLSGEEIAQIKSQGNEIASKMRVLYQSLALVDNMYGNTSSSSGESQSYTAGSSVPIVYNNYITIDAGIFWGDKDQARECAMWIRDEIKAEEARG